MLSGAAAHRREDQSQKFPKTRRGVSPSTKTCEHARETISLPWRTGAVSHSLRNGRLWTRQQNASKLSSSFLSTHFLGRLATLLALFISGKCNVSSSEAAWLPGALLRRTPSRSQACLCTQLSTHQARLHRSVPLLCSGEWSACTLLLLRFLLMTYSVRTSLILSLFFRELSASCFPQMMLLFLNIGNSGNLGNTEEATPDSQGLQKSWALPARSEGGLMRGIEHSMERS